MKIKTITYTYQRIKTGSNYESERLKLFAELDINENIEGAIASLRDKVERSLNIKDDLIGDINIDKP